MRGVPALRVGPWARGGEIHGNTIDEDQMTLEIDNGVVSVARPRSGGRWNVSRWPMPSHYNQAITASTATELLLTGYTRDGQPAQAVLAEREIFAVPAASGRPDYGSWL